MSSKFMAPIALFVYNRIEHTKATVDALRNNSLASDSNLYIFSDAARSSNDYDEVDEVRNYIRTVSGFKKVEIIERESNLGLANSIVQGVSKLCHEFGKVIVLEDDLVTSSNFLSYMNEGLERYKDNEQVMQIAGYNFPNDINHQTDAIFFSFICSWGWATWQRAWQEYDESAKKISELRNSRKLRKQFDLEDHYPYYKMLVNQQKGKTDSWAIRWYLSVFFKNGLVLYPKKTLVRNIGFDGTGENCLVSDIDEMPILGELNIKVWPTEIRLCEKHKEVFKTLPRPTLSFTMLIRYVKRYLGSFGR